VRELTLETGEYKLTVRRGFDAAPSASLQQATSSALGTAPGPATSATGLANAAPDGAVAAALAAKPDERLIEVVAPIVGTFYSSPSPDAPAYVRVGERVKVGAVLCIIEAMKLMNEIEAEVAGTVREILVENDEPVEYGQVLFRIEPD